MSTTTKKPTLNELQIPLVDFLKFYNKNLPAPFPHATTALLKKYKTEHEVFFKNGELWSVDLHRKKVMDWLPNNLKN